MYKRLPPNFISEILFLHLTKRNIEKLRTRLPSGAMKKEKVSIKSPRFRELVVNDALYLKEVLEEVCEK